MTALLQPTSVLGIALGNGWFRGRLGWSGGSAYYGTILLRSPSSRSSFLTATSRPWSPTKGGGPDPRRCCSMTSTTARQSCATLSGHVVGARLLRQVVDRCAPCRARLRQAHPYLGPPVRRQEELRPIKIWTSPAGKMLVDFGQNLVGWVRVHVQGSAGTTITLRHAEVLENGELGTRPLRSAKAADRFILSGADDAFEPTFTFHGFRYVEVDGWPGEVPSDALTAVVVHSDMQRISEFECSDELLNQLYRNVVWGTRGNFLDVPTDCPSETSGSVGRVISQSSRPLPPTCSMWRTSFGTGLQTWPRSSERPMAWCPSSCPTS